MEAPLTEHQVPTQPKKDPLFQLFADAPRPPPTTTSTQLLDIIYQTLNSPTNHRQPNPHKASIHLDETHQTVVVRCKCKKSKCLKLYCECFAQGNFVCDSGSFCKDCNCSCCQNTQEFSDIRAKAIDEVMIRATVPFGHKNSSIKGCNCKKTGCQKKYCECYRSGDKCSQYCKCESCTNS